MTVVKKVELQRGGLVLDVPCYGRVALGKPSQCGRRPLSGVIIQTEGGRTVIPDFAQLIPSLANGDDAPVLLYCAFGDREAPFLALVGLFEVVFLAPDSHLTIRHDLRRDMNDDWGGFRSELIGRRSGFVFAYEAGALAFAPTGRTLWERPLSPHDYLLSHDRGQLQFRSDEFSDYGSGDWFVDLDTGALRRDEHPGLASSSGEQ